MNGKIYLVPLPLHQENCDTIPEYVKAIVKDLRYFIVEEIRTAQQFLKKITPGLLLTSCEFLVFNEHSQPAQAREILEKIAGKDVGLLSEAGVPCVADPGSDIVSLAHQKNIEIIPLVGPSSILLALMGSGLNGQHFAFHGYLPKEKEERERKFHALEQTSLKEQQTQIFMEAPYRNQKLFEEILTVLHPKTLLSIALDLTGASQSIKTMSIEQWRKEKGANLNDRPAIFLIQKKLN